MFGGLIEDEKKTEENLNTEVVKAVSDESGGFKSVGIHKEETDEDLENRPEQKLKISDVGSGSDSDSDFDISYTDGPEPLDYYERLQQVEDVASFLDAYKFAQGEKICIFPGGAPILCLSDKCFESTWVGVHGMQSICMVIRRNMDITRLPVFYQRDSRKHQNMRKFASAVISEVECLPHKDVGYYDDGFHRQYSGTIKKPFGVVSVGLGTLEESGYEDSKPPHCRVSKTINFLESVVSSDLLHTHYGIIRVAIESYQLMCHKELRAEDIWVTIMDSSSRWSDHLPLDIIGEQLDFVNGHSSEKDPQKPLFEYRGLCKESD